MSYLNEVESMVSDLLSYLKNDEDSWNILVDTESIEVSQNQDNQSCFRVSMELYHRSLLIWKALLPPVLQSFMIFDSGRNGMR